MAAQITDAKKEAITRRALEKMRESKDPLNVELSISLAVGLIGQLQLAFRHPQNVGPSRAQLELFVRDLIERLDPEHGDLYTVLIMGFHECYDE
jgi:hypothetical protein